MLVQVSSVQLRDDLLSMLVAGHETTGSVLTWTVYLLSKVNRVASSIQFPTLKAQSICFLDPAIHEVDGNPLSTSSPNQRNVCIYMFAAQIALKNLVSVPAWSVLISEAVDAVRWCFKSFLGSYTTTYRTNVLFFQNPSALAKVQEELDRVLGGRKPQFSDIKELKYLTRCINESMRIYPHPPVCNPHHSCLMDVEALIRWSPANIYNSAIGHFNIPIKRIEILVVISKPSLKMLWLKYLLLVLFSRAQDWGLFLPIAQLLTEELYVILV